MTAEAATTTVDNTQHHPVRKRRSRRGGSPKNNYVPVELTTHHDDFNAKVEALKAQGWQQREVAQSIKVNEAMLSYWLRRRNRLSYEVYQRSVGTLNKLLALRKASEVRWGKKPTAAAPSSNGAAATTLPSTTGLNLLTKVAAQLSPEDIQALVGHALAMWARKA